MKPQLLAWSWRPLAAGVLLNLAWLPPITGQLPFAALAATTETSAEPRPASTFAPLASLHASVHPFPSFSASSHFD